MAQTVEEAFAELQKCCENGERIRSFKHNGKEVAVNWDASGKPSLKAPKTQKAAEEKPPRKPRKKGFVPVPKKSKK